MHDDHPHDDLHDRGLAFDLATLRARRPTHAVDRRHALRLLAGAGAGVVLVACSSDSGSSASSTSSSSTSTTGAALHDHRRGRRVGRRRPAGDRWPVPGRRIQRAQRPRRERRRPPGHPLQLRRPTPARPRAIPLNIALPGRRRRLAAPPRGRRRLRVALHRRRRLPLYSDGITDQNYLRGVQAADADGNLSFTSIYPGAYDGRWPHIHFEVFQDVDTATIGGSPIVTSQIALPEGASREAYLTDGLRAAA